ncbi:WXG100 family type VII secretion target, partial [Nocardia sp. NPDC050710]|uniref:WXG100 family type VII secretion target n=1 Tax=Nocardia sp. NPDC050710 TaxID=3157220 RepID=UPI0033C965CE
MAEGTELTAASDANADDILSDGATGLMYFEEYLPRYARCDTILHLMYFAKDDIAALDYKSFYPKYDVERGMDIKALDQMAAAVSKAVTTTQEELTKQGAQRTALPAVWKGQAGDAAFASLDAQIKRATDDHAEALAISTALTGAATTLRKIVREKAQAVKDYWHPDLPDIPDRTTGVGRKKIDIYLDEAEHYPTSKEGKEAIEWLTKHFMPHVEGRVSGFNDLCSKTEKSVQDTYDTLITALNKLDTTAYPMPAETQIPTGTPTSGTPSTGTPTSGTPSTGTPTSGTPSTGTPTSGTPSTG